jgi:uncharacterized protein (DUF885 family)
MGIRVKSVWNRKGKQHSWEEIGGAVAFTIWRLAGQGVLNLENEGFQTDSQVQRLEVMSEFMAFLVHVSDRLTHEANSDQDREQFIQAVARSLAATYRDNMADVANGTDRQRIFIEKLNSRMSDYADFAFEDDGPGYAMRRYFGHQVTESMGPKDKKWISDQVMEIEVPEALKGLRKALGGLVPSPPPVDDIIDELRKKMPDDY